MILTVTLNPALDLTYEVPDLRLHATHRVSAVYERPGGKGLNVAGVLHALGEPVLATGLLGGLTGARVQALLDASGLASSFVPVAGKTRRTVTVVDRADATGLWEPGPVVGGPEWAGFVARFRTLLDGAAVVTLSGSLPAGVPVDAYAVLIGIARDRGVVSVLDTSGPALRAGLLAGPTLVKPNEAELADLLGPVSGDLAEVRALLAADTRAIVVSRGPRGLHAVTPTGAWQAVPPHEVRGNPTGAGDACVAALARGLRDQTPWPALLGDAVALSAAAVAARVAGQIDMSEYARIKETQDADPDG